jgi:hypothetical protein
VLVGEDAARTGRASRSRAAPAAVGRASAASAVPSSGDAGVLGQGWLGQCLILADSGQVGDGASAHSGPTKAQTSRLVAARDSVCHDDTQLTDSRG